MRLVGAARVDRATSPLLTRRSHLRGAGRGWQSVGDAVSVDARRVNLLAIDLSSHEALQFVNASILVVVYPPVPSRLSL